MTQTAEVTLPSPVSLLPQEIDGLPLPYIEVDINGIVKRANLAARTLHHPDQGDLIGSLGWDLMAADQQQCSHAAFTALMNSGGEPTIVFRSIFDRSGKYRTYELHRGIICGKECRPAGMRVVMIDVTDTVKALDEARDELQWMQNAMASMADAVFLTDTLGMVRSANIAAGDLAGVSVNELIGITIEKALPAIRDDCKDCAPFDHVKAIEQDCRGTAVVLNRHEHKVRVEYNTSPILDRATGSVSGIVAIVRCLGEAE